MIYSPAQKATPACRNGRLPDERTLNLACTGQAGVSSSEDMHRAKWIEGS
jgi:hypothetical protein